MMQAASPAIPQAYCRLKHAMIDKIKATGIIIIDVNMLVIPKIRAHMPTVGLGGLINSTVIRLVEGSLTVLPQWAPVLPFSSSSCAPHDLQNISA